MAWQQFLTQIDNYCTDNQHDKFKCNITHTRFAISVYRPYQTSYDTSIEQNLTLGVPTRNQSMGPASRLRTLQHGIDLLIILASNIEYELQCMVIECLCISINVLVKYITTKI